MTMKYGWKRDLPDQRDHVYSLALSAGTLPDSVDLRPQCPVVYNQGRLGSCTANALGSMIEFLEIKEKLNDQYTPSRLFIYYYERLIEHTIGYDAGAALRDGMKVLVNLGAPHENLWPYNISLFKETPPIACYNDALNHKVVQYQRLTQDLNSLKSCLADGFPFAFGFTVYQNFEATDIAQNGIMHMPSGGTLGGHAVKAVGYDESKQWFIVKNSWGVQWGDKGYFYMPYQYITNSHLASDFWTAKMVK